MSHTRWMLPIGMLWGVVGCAAPAVDQLPVVEVDGHVEALSEFECALLEGFANGENNQSVLDRMNERLTGISTPVGVRDGKEIRIQGVDSVNFAGCRATMKLRVKLRRPGIRQDAEGTMVVKGDVYPAQRNVFHDEMADNVIVGEISFVEDQLCLRNMDVDSVDLSHLSDAIGEPLFEWLADKDDAACYAAGTLWVDVQNQLPIPVAIPFEQSPDLDTRSGWPIGSALCGNSLCPETVVLPCGTMDEFGNCGACLLVNEQCTPCAYDGTGNCVPYQTPVLF